ncbi:putative regulator of nonsense transcripts 3A [Hyaloscypha sp. PMI_1271]|nr:putative regulator of nonsense transcripts 3A [Hyaloscypha sp. PMI_1271]
MATPTTPGGSRGHMNGVLAITASQTSGNGIRSVVSKPLSPKLKVVIRRLAPGLTEAEFTSILGDGWSLGQGKVDWFLYKPGKDSKDPSKPSRPSRAYLRLTHESHLLNLSDLVRESIFEDAHNTFTSQCLIGPPTVEFAPYGRTPGGRRRIDARAGTIDQDPEFMAFLEGLANPLTSKEANADVVLDGTSTKQEKVTTTPLVQYLKDKKANKSKEMAAKAAKKQEAQLAKAKAGKESSSSLDDSKKKGKEGKSDKLIEKAAREAVKILNREAATKASSAASISEASGSEISGTPKLDVTKVHGRQRPAVIAAHIKMLQRDLGLSPAQAHRQVRRDTADALKAERAAVAEKAAAESKEASSSQPSQAQTIPTAPKASNNQAKERKSRAKGSSTESETGKASGSASTPAANPVVLLKKPESQQTQRPVPSPTIQQPKPAPVLSRKPPPVAVPSEGATQAFVKHANPSQGVTEALLKEAMENFGAVSMVEIDKRKGFAYVDFVDTEGLKKAMAANPIPVAQGTVQVMQRKGTALPPEKKPANQPPNAPSRGGRAGRGGTIGRRGGRGGARGGAQAGPSEAAKAPSAAPTGPAAK